jgi:chromosome segregation ATPase
VPSESEDLEARVTAVEHEIRRVGENAAAARVLAVGADRDVADLKVKLDAHTKVLSALRETQLEHGERLNSLEAEMRQGFAKLGAGMSYIPILLEHLDQRD